MANNEKAISELTTASEIKNSDNLELSQDTGSGLVSLKATILAIANKIVSNINFTSALETNSKTITGAINEVAQGGGGGGSSTLDGLNDVDIDDTTLADGQALVYDEIEEKWVNGQGGGGTGGHTIIDENGNSMTARAGLQFVGGANVSDDGTNNKTIVDLASAGGIDGVFVDTDNVIVPETTYSGSLSYTATEDCVVFVNVLATSSGGGWVYIDNKLVGRVYFAGSVIINGSYYLLKKGQTLTASSQTYSGIDITYAVYGIQTGTTHSKFQPVIYSTEEREVGVWTDGKPLYEKTFIDTLPSSTTSKDIPLNISNIDRIVSLKGIAIRSDGATAQIEHARTDDTIWSMINGAKTVLSINIKDSSYINQPVHFTVQYTKTTDTAGSGSWTPQGVPTHHYSTDEQVIGTWIDGSTLYQKTVHTGALSTGEGTKPHNISNFGTLINATGIAYYSGYTLTFPFISIGQNSWNLGIGGADTNNIITEVGSSFTGNSAITDSYITLQYTKSSS